MGKGPLAGYRAGAGTGRAGAFIMALPHVDVVVPGLCRHEGVVKRSIRAADPLGLEPARAAIGRRSCHGNASA